MMQFRYQVSRELNEFLGGGTETSTVTELFGESRTGKLQLRHMLAGWIVSTPLSIRAMQEAYIYG